MKYIPKYLREKPLRPLLHQKGGLLSSLNPYNWNVPDYSRLGKFDLAYKTAKKDGHKEFMWNNNRYSTKYAGTPRQEVGQYGTNGKPVHPLDINSPIQVNRYKEVVSEYLPGHIEAGIPVGHVGLVGGVNKGISGKSKNKFIPSSDIAEQIYVYGVDNYDPSKVKPEYNLLTNNCADAVCDAFGLSRNGITTPRGTMSDIKKQFQTIDVTDRTYKDYFQQYRNQRNDILNNADYWIGIASSPDIQDTQLGKDIIRSIQSSLVNKNYKLPKSFDTNGQLDAVYGEETKSALKDWQRNNKK